MARGVRSNLKESHNCGVEILLYLGCTKREKMREEGHSPRNDRGGILVILKTAETRGQLRDGIKWGKKSAETGVGDSCVNVEQPIVGATRS